MSTSKCRKRRELINKLIRKYSIKTLKKNTYKEYNIDNKRFLQLKLAKVKKKKTEEKHEKDK